MIEEVMTAASVVKGMAVFDFRQTALIGGLAGRVMRAEEFIDGGGPGQLQERELGPTLEEVGRPGGCGYLEPVQDLRK